MDYKANPIDTSDVILSDELIELTEKLAENTHEIWAEIRQEDGWVYGKTRNDLKKEHPNLVPYDDLTDTEKKIPRDTAMETIRLILKLGYEIEKD